MCRTLDHAGANHFSHRLKGKACLFVHMASVAGSDVRLEYECVCWTCVVVVSKATPPTHPTHPRAYIHVNKQGNWLLEYVHC